MDNKSAVFASARVKAKESKMIGRERLVRMTEAGSAEEVLKILNETAYAESGISSEPSCYRQLIEAELCSLLSFFKEICPDKSVLKSFMLFYEYNNIKALVKAKYHRLESYGNMLYVQGITEPKQLAEYIFADNYIFLSAFAARALGEIDSAYASGGKNPALWDCILNKALYSELSAEMQSCKEEKVKAYFSLKADVENYLTVLKCRLMSLPKKEMERQFVGGGSINLKTYEQTFGASDDTAAEFFRYSEISELARKGFKSLSAGGISEAERDADNMLDSYFSNKANEMSTVYPLLNYYLQKLAELKNVNLIFTAVSGGADKAEIKKRMRAV